MSHRFRIVAKLILTLALLTFLLLRMDLTEFWSVLSSARWSLVAVAVAIYLMAAVLSVVRWGLILDKFDIRPPLRSLAQITFIGYFFNLFLPSAFGGDFFRAYYLAKGEDRGMSTTLTTILLDRFGGMLSLLMIGTLALVVNPVAVGGVPLLPIFAAMLAAFVGGVIALFNDWTHKRLRQLLERFNREDIEAKIELVAGGLAKLRRCPTTISLAMAISMTLQIASILIMWIAARAIGIEAPLWVFVTFIPIVNITLAFPLTINGLGVRETVYYLLFAQIGVPMEAAVTLSLLQFLIMATTAVPGAIAYTFYKRSQPDVVKDTWKLDPGDVEGLVGEGSKH